MSKSLKNKSYQYIWYFLYSNKIKKEKIKYIYSDQISPYFETNDETINNIITNIIKVNPYYRFSNIYDIFFDVDNISKNENNKFSDIFFNLSMHLLGNLDLHISKNKKDIYCKKIINELETNNYSNKISKMYNKLKYEDKFIIADSLYNHYKNTEMISSLEYSIKKLFPDSVIYNYIISENRIAMYINAEKKDINYYKIKIVTKLFCPIRLKINIYWSNNFIILGNKNSSLINENCIF